MLAYTSQPVLLACFLTMAKENLIFSESMVTYSPEPQVLFEKRIINQRDQTGRPVHAHSMDGPSFYSCHRVGRLDKFISN